MKERRQYRWLLRLAWLAASLVWWTSSSSSSSTHYTAAAQEEECRVHADGTETCETPCVDKFHHGICERLAQKNGCITDFPNMQHRCPQTCFICETATMPPDEDTPWIIPRVYNLPDAPQLLDGSQREEEYRYLQDVDRYMYETVYVDDDNYTPEVRVACQNRHELCTFWAMLGECDKNPNFMLKDCAASCFRCDYLDMAKRCAFDHDLPVHFAQPGDLNAMFARILEEPQLAPYQPRAVLQPPEGPWIVVLEDFLSEVECNTLIQLGHDRGYERSTNVGARKYDGTYEAAKQSSRTSYNTWCMEECWEDAVVQNIHDRLELLTGVNRSNYEYLQLLRYEEGEFYDRHHDFIDHHLERAEGPRVLTVFMYLNDVEEGGETSFTDVNVSVTPKMGRVVIWPSVFDDDPMETDPSTHHKAEPVLAGIKYGANAWIHQRDFKTPFKEACH